MSKRDKGKRMIRRPRKGDVIANRHLHGTKQWFSFAVETPTQGLTVTTAPMLSENRAAAAEADTSGSM